MLEKLYIHNTREIGFSVYVCVAQLEDWSASRSDRAGDQKSTRSPYDLSPGVGSSVMFM